jgi:hypothetical protein
MRPRESAPMPEVIGLPAQRMMEPETEGLTGVAHGEKSPEHLAQCDGYRDRTWETGVGTVELRIVKPRLVSCFAGFVERGRIAEEALHDGRVGASTGARLDPLVRRPGQSSGAERVFDKQVGRT